MISHGRALVSGGTFLGLQSVLNWHVDYATFVVVVIAALALVIRSLARRTHVPRLGASFWVLTLTILAVGFAPTQFFGERERDNRREGLQGIAPTFAREIEARGHARLASDAPPSDPIYNELIHAEERWLKANPGVADIYTLRKLGGKTYLIVDSETDYNKNGVYDTPKERRTPIGTEYPEPTAGMLAAFDGNPGFDSEPYTDEWGTWVSAFEPLRDAQGNVEGILGVDYPAASWLKASLVARMCSMGGILFVITLLTGTIVIVRVQQGALAARRIIEEQLREARDAAEASSQSKSTFLANMSHEIRTPMSAILGFVDLLDEVPPEVRRQHIATIRSNGEHLLTVINDILDLSKIEAGGMTLEKTECSIVSIVHDVRDLLSVRAAAKSIALELDVQFPIPASITSDPLRIRQIILNLVGNALKFTPSGSVTMRVRLDESAQRIEIAVIDTGIGMDQPTIDRLFRPFSQADASTTRKFGGTGLGLTISKRLADGLGGTLAVSSQSGKGSTFTLSLPTGSLKGAEMLRGWSAPSASVPSAGGNKQIPARILLIEDGPDNQRLFMHYLKSCGASVSIAENGSVGLETIEHSGEFDLILLDMQMPVMDGYTAAAAIRARGIQTPIIALTANAMSGDRDRCLAAGCSDYLTKPVPRALLIERCAHWYARTRAVNAQ